MNTIQKIFKNMGMMGLSQIFVSIIGFFLLIYIARYLGESEYGVYSFAMSFTTLFIVIADLGMSQLIIRNVARKKELRAKYFTNTSLIKLILSFFTITLIFITISLIRPDEIVLIVFLFGIYTIFSSFTQMFMSFFQAFEEMEYSAIVIIVEKILLLIFVIIVMYKDLGLLYIAYTYIAADIIQFIFALFLLLKQIKKTELQIDISCWKPLLINSLPFGLNTLFGMIFFKVDTVILSLLDTDMAVGIYNAAYNPLLALSGVISSMVTSALYPVMSRYYSAPENSLDQLTAISIRYMFIIGFPIAIGCLLLADQFITLFYGFKYSNSVIAFQLLAIFIPIRLVSGITGTLLSSINKQGTRTFSVFISSIFNIACNILLIPILSYIGACIATVLSELMLYFLLIYFINRYHKTLNIHKNVTKPLIASLIMGIVLFFIKGYNLFGIIVVGMILYILLLFLFRTFGKEDKYIFKQILQKK